MPRITPWVLIVVCVVVTTTCVAVHPVREGLTRLSHQPTTVPRDGSPSRRKTSLGQTCENSSSSCYAGEQCCNGGSNGGSMCCPGNTTCCQDTCCSNSTDYKAESCCPDPKNGGVCCLTENTFCCPPNPELDQPSRCCPRWYVCCAQGRYGCCNPDTGLSMDEEEALLMKAPSVGTMEGGAALPHAYALFAETNAWTDNERLYGATVNLINASYSQVKVEVGVFHTDQEMTRRFMFRRSTNTFLLLQANFTDKALDFPITLYTINPATGASTATPVVGARDEVTGMHYVEEVDKILMATWWFTDDDARHKVGYKFYTVDPVTAVATLLSKVNNSDYTTLDHDTYAGWFHEASSDLKYVYRIGFASEINDIDYGLGVVDISQTVGKVLRWTALQDPRFHGRLRTLHRYNKTSPTSIHAPVGNDDPWNVDFVSLAQSNNITTDGDLALYAWNPSNVTASIRQVAQYGNAHLQAYFGPIAEAVDSSRTKYAAAVVQDSLLGDSFDTWGLAVADLVTGQSALIGLSPSLLASTSSISGFGVPTSADGITALLNKVHK